MFSFEVAVRSIIIVSFLARQAFQLLCKHYAFVFTSPALISYISPFIFISHHYWHYHPYHDRGLPRQISRRQNMHKEQSGKRTWLFQLLYRSVQPHIQSENHVLLHYMLHYSFAFDPMLVLVGNPNVIVPIVVTRGFNHFAGKHGAAIQAGYGNGAIFGAGGLLVGYVITHHMTVGLNLSAVNLNEANGASLGFHTGFGASRFFDRSSTARGMPAAPSGMRLSSVPQSSHFSTSMPFSVQVGSVSILKTLEGCSHVLGSPLTSVAKAVQPAHRANVNRNKNSLSVVFILFTSTKCRVTPLVALDR